MCFPFSAPKNFPVVCVIIGSEWKWQKKFKTHCVALAPKAHLHKREILYDMSFDLYVTKISIHSNQSLKAYPYQIIFE
jgi:hypothetical protein